MSHTARMTAVALVSAMLFSCAGLWLGLSYLGVVSRDVRVAATVTSFGDGLSPGAKVRFHGLIVGTVHDVAPKDAKFTTGEILVRGPIVTPGYHRAPEATAELVDADGWVHTGDIGEIDDEGFLRVVDRKSEMIITSSGKNIAPSNVENLVKESPLIGHAMVVGEGRPYLVAVLTLDPEIAPLIAQKLGIDFTAIADLARHPAILAAVGQAIEAANARLSRPEQVKAFELLPEEWTAESEELTPTLKLKRRVVTSKHSDIIDRLYGIPDEGR